MTKIFLFQSLTCTTLYRPSIEHFQGYPVRDRIALGRNIRRRPLGFRQKIPRSANEQMESWGQVISNLETGYALTMSILGLIQQFQKYPKEQCLPSVPMQPAPVTRIYTLQLLSL